MLKLTPITFDKYLSEHDPYAKKTVEIDLTEVQFISPAVLTQLSALCYDLKNLNKQVTVKLNRKIWLYLMRAGFIPSIRPVAKIEPAEFELARYYEVLHGSNPLLIEVTKIENVDALPKLFERIVNALQARLQFPDNEAFDIVTAISEVCQNIFDHNNGICGFIAMQVYKTGKESFLQIGISDYGDGLWQSLKRNVKNKGIKSHVEAINYATRALTSEYDDPTRGTGLYHLLNIMKKNSGVVQIRTGCGKVRYGLQKKIEWDMDTTPYMQGVHIALDINTKVV